MDRLFIDIDNKTPGAIIKQIVEFLLPRCPNGGGVGRLGSVLLVNKYFNQTVVLATACQIETIFGVGKCKKHSPDYAELKNCEGVIDAAVKNTTQGWIHFDTVEEANNALCHVQQRFTVGGRCCSGKGIKIRGAAPMGGWY